MKKLKLYLMVSTLAIATFAITGCSTETSTEIDEPTEVVEEVAEIIEDDIPEETKVESEVIEEDVIEEDTILDEEELAVEDSESEEDAIEESEEVLPEYTYTDSTATMYAKSVVNVRDLPSTDGERMGGLSYNQEVAVTGSCNETGWYRIDYNGSVGYVSGSYLLTEKIVEVVVETPVETQQDTTSETDVTTTVETSTATGLSYTSLIGTELKQGMVLTQEDRDAAIEIFNLINADRTAAGLPALTWNEDLYELALTRVIENDLANTGNAHTNMRGCTRENAHSGYGVAIYIHEAFKNSPTHYANYMATDITTCAVGKINGKTYELFY